MKTWAYSSWGFYLCAVWDNRPYSWTATLYTACKGTCFQHDEDNLWTLLDIFLFGILWNIYTMKDIFVIYFIAYDCFTLYGTNYFKQHSKPIFKIYKSEKNHETLLAFCCCCCYCCCSSHYFNNTATGCQKLAVTSIVYAVLFSPSSISQ